MISQAHGLSNDLVAFNEEDFGENEVIYEDFSTNFVPKLVSETPTDLPPFTVYKTNLDKFERLEAEIEPHKFNTDLAEFECQTEILCQA